MQNELPTLTLENIGGEGVAKELVDKEIERVLANIMDAGTKATSKREINVKIVFEPSKDREGGSVSLQVQTKLAHAQGYASAMFIGMRRGVPVATTFNPAQQQLAFDKESELTKIPREEEATG